MIDNSLIDVIIPRLVMRLIEMEWRKNDIIAYCVISICFVVWGLYVIMFLLPPDFLVYMETYHPLQTDPVVYINTVLRDSSTELHGAFKSRLLTLVLVAFILPFTSVEIAFCIVNLTAAWIAFLLFYRWGTQHYKIQDYGMIIILLSVFVTRSMLAYIWQPWIDAVNLLFLGLTLWAVDTKKYKIAMIFSIIGILNHWIILFAWLRPFISSLFDREYSSLKFIVLPSIVAGITILLPLNSFVFGVEFSSVDFFDYYGTVFYSHVFTTGYLIYQLRGLAYNLYAIGILALIGLYTKVKTNTLSHDDKSSIITLAIFGIFLYSLGTLIRQALLLFPFMFVFVCAGTSRLITWFSTLRERSVIHE